MTASIMTSTTPIRVSVQFKEPSVFAGEDVECTITFTNVTPTDADRSSPPGEPAGGGKQLLHPERASRKPLPTQHPPSVSGSVAHSIAPTIPSSVQHSASVQPAVSRKSSLHDGGTPGGSAAAAAAVAATGRARGHRPALSLNTPHLQGARTPSIPNSGFNGAPSPSQHKHARSLSIYSVGSNGLAGENNGNGTIGPAPRRPGRGHGRSTSLQVVPGRGGFGSPGGSRSPLQPSPNLGASPPAFSRSRTDFSIPTRAGRRTSGPTGTATGSSPNTPGPGVSRKPSGSFIQSFKFPPSPLEQSPSLADRSPALEVSLAEDVFKIPRTREQSATPSISGEKLAPSPVTRIISGSSMNGTPRSSGEFNYTMSNNSSETLVSEYASRPTTRLLSSGRPGQDRRSLPLGPSGLRQQQKQPEVLMMGYAQVMGSFTLDGSLVNQAPFEEVKRKGVVGGQGGGGVVGVEQKKRESGLFGALGWSNIGESLGGLLGGSEPSSIREMRAVASLKTIPLLSTPQSILFVDLRLAPGESRSYTYSFTLPRGLPPTHKGRAMKVNYHLSIGTQRPGGARHQQAVRSVNVPFRVFGSVTNRGEILGHDLMSPYIILRDQSRIKAIPNPKSSLAINGIGGKKSSDDGKDSATEFMNYVNKLMDRPSDSANGLLSPTLLPPPSFRRRSTMESEQLGISSMKEAIDFAILRSNVSHPGTASSNRFEIARNGRRVGVISLARPAYRLGETISCTIDFSKGDVPVFGIAVALESAEKVDAAIALRSTSSVHRATRKVHAGFAETTLFARRVSFAPTIPPGATPEFITSGVCLEWKLRVEFVTPRLTAGVSASAVQSRQGSRTGSTAGLPGGQSQQQQQLMEDDDDEEFEEVEAVSKPWGRLLEDAGSDERGTVLAAVERLHCESFEVAVPIRVYGAVAGTDGSVGGEEEGYVI